MGESSLSITMNKINLAEKLSLINEHWRPKVIGELNGQEIKVVKFQGEFPWHQHENEDEMFMALKGDFRIEFRDRTVELKPGEFVIVPHGVEHRPVADEEVEVLLFEPANLKNTGNIEDERYTAPIGEKV
jgi:mannose-6-phosphate isomerase-like protein (cupin superfamily)